MPTLNKRKREILSALRRLGGEASIQQIARESRYSANGISQSEGFFENVASLIEATTNADGERIWKIKEQPQLEFPETSSL